jgi:hypothetical protein
MPRAHHVVVALGLLLVARGGRGQKCSGEPLDPSSAPAAVPPPNAANDPAPHVPVRRALVVGNKEYTRAPNDITRLYSPENDATDIAAALTKADFKVTVCMELTGDEIITNVRRFSRLLESRDIALFYFSGHGTEVDGENYLIGVDFERKPPDYDYWERPKEAFVRDLKAYSTSMKAILDLFKVRETQSNIIILDACRSSPFTSSWKGAEAGVNHLAPMEGPPGTYIAFATSPGDVANDGHPGSKSGKPKSTTAQPKSADPPGENLGQNPSQPKLPGVVVEVRNSLFTRYILVELEKRGRELDAVFRDARLQMWKDAQQRREAIPQMPWSNSSMTLDFFFLQPHPKQ